MIDSIWRRAYDAWQKSGLTRRAFHQTHISTFFPEQPPCIWTLYKKFQQIERLIEAEAVSRIQNAALLPWSSSQPFPFTPPNLPAFRRSRKSRFRSCVRSAARTVPHGRCV